MNIIEHAERFLGGISKGWRADAHPDGLQVVCFDNAPFENTDTYMTIGLSRHELRVSDEKTICQELVLPVSGIYNSENLLSLLLYICETVLSGHCAILRGQVIRLPPEAVERLQYDAVYCAIPVFMDEDFATFRSFLPPTVIVWLVPIYKSEADYVDANGWNNFEDLLDEINPDLFYFGRDPIV